MTIAVTVRTKKGKNCPYESQYNSGDVAREVAYLFIVTIICPRHFVWASGRSAVKVMVLRATPYAAYRQTNQTLIKLFKELCV